MSDREKKKSAENARRLSGVSLLPPSLNPALRANDELRHQSLQIRLADHITAFIGSLLFVYLHMTWFAVWIIAGVEKFPFSRLGTLVSIEAIFLTSFVLVSQNRADEKRQVLADQQWLLVQEGERQNRQILELSHKILELTEAVHERTVAAS